MWWECPVHDAIRCNVWGETRPDHCLLPPLLREAMVAPHIRVCPGKCWWGAECGEGAQQWPGCVWSQPPEAVIECLDLAFGKGGWRDMELDRLFASVQGGWNIDLPVPA
eukprot:15470904-Alexandrium_andersonii.AAC.1